MVSILRSSSTRIWRKTLGKCESTEQDSNLRPGVRSPMLNPTQLPVRMDRVGLEPTVLLGTGLQPAELPVAHPIRLCYAPAPGGVT